MAEKLKAAHIPISELQIGNYRKVSIHQGDLVAKIYYARKKLVWETLDHTKLKNKIEIQLEDILSMRAIIDENNGGTLMIELNRPPTFFHEMAPQPRKHTKWEPSWDFTQNQASICRRHMLKFPPEELDKHYEKLIQIDSRLKHLRQVPFPTLTDPYFPSINLTNLSNGYAVHESVIGTSAPLLTNPIQSLTSDVALSPSHEIIYNQRLEDLCHPISSQGVNSYDVHGSFVRTSTAMLTTHQVRNPIQLPTTVTNVAVSPLYEVIYNRRLEDVCPLVPTLGDNGYDVHRPFTGTPTLMLTTHQVGNSIQFPTTDVVLSDQHNVINSQRFEDSSLPILSQGVNGYVHSPFACTLAPMLTTHQVQNPRQLSTPVTNVDLCPLHEKINSHTLEDSSLTIANQAVNVFETLYESIDYVPEANHEEPQRAWTFEDLSKFYADLESGSDTVSHERHITSLPREEDPAQNINTNTQVESWQECTYRQCSDEGRLLQPQPQPQPPQCRMSFVYLFLFVVSFLHGAFGNIRLKGLHVSWLFIFAFSCCCKVSNILSWKKT